MQATRPVDSKLLAATGALFLLLFVPLAARDWWVLHREALHDIEWHTTTVTLLLSKHLEQSAPLSTLLSQLDDPETYRELDSRIRDRIGVAGLEKVHIYDTDGEMVYATDAELVGEGFKGEVALGEAADGAVVTKFIDRGDYEAEYGEAVPVDMAEVYMPVRGGPDQDVSYVFEAYHDYTPFFVRNRRMWLGNAAVLATVIAASLGVLLLAFRRNRLLAGRVRVLESFLPICSYCKKIRVEDEGEGPARWIRVETYFSERDAVRFSHGICEECIDTHHPGVRRR